jgi:hypothetical protein
MRNSLRKGLQIVTAIICMASGNAMAQAGFGIRGGLGDTGGGQFHFGSHYVSKNFINNFYARPSLEYGIGSDLKIFTANFDVAYRFMDNNSEWSVYVCGGPALVVTSLGPSHRNDSSYPLINGTGKGISITTGVERTKGFMVEIRVGLYDSPGKKITFGYTF